MSLACAPDEQRHALLDDDATLNDILERWHRWASDERTATGYPTTTVSCRTYRVSRQYDDNNGAMDQDIENVIMAGVDACVTSISQPWRNALHINARNLCTGLAVWRSPRLPEDDLARALMVSDARVMLVDLLRKRGLL